LDRPGGSSTATASASKKSVRAAEQDRPDVAAARTAWADVQARLDPERLRVGSSRHPVCLKRTVSLNSERFIVNLVDEGSVG
jgi:hypothetical protein